MAINDRRYVFLYRKLPGKLWKEAAGSVYMSTKKAAVKDRRLAYGARGDFSQKKIYNNDE